MLLAAITATAAGLLVLDEPTNNLDISTIEALESALQAYTGGILLASHDRDFVEDVGVTEVISVSQ